MNIVTGATGFIGSNLIETLIAKDKKVVGIDIDITRKHLVKSFINGNFSILWSDVNYIDNYIKKGLEDIDMIYHLAASADIRKSYEFPQMDLKNNVLGTNAVLELMRKNDIKNLVFSSTSSVYGIPEIQPTPENVPNIRPISMYGASKLANEAFISAYCDLYGLKVWAFRFANVVGKNMHRGVIFDFIQKLKQNQHELEILGDGKQTKSFFDVSDCVAGLIDIPKKDGNKSMTVYNLGNTDLITVKEIADIVCDELGVKPNYNFTGGDRGWKGDTPSTILSIKKALKTGWKPKYNCEESVKRTVRWLLDNQ